jgi:GAF domain-containing protein
MSGSRTGQIESRGFWGAWIRTFSFFVAGHLYRRDRNPTPAQGGFGMRLEDSVKKVEMAAPDGLAHAVDALIEEASSLLGSPISYFALMNGDCSVLTMIGWSNQVMANCSMIDKPIVYSLVDTGLWGDCVREKGPVVTNDYKALSKPTKKGYPEGHIAINRHLNVCMMGDGKIMGVLGVGNKTEPYADSDVQLLQDFANGCFAFLPAAEIAAIVG